MDQTQLDNAPFHLKEDQLPCLVSYQDKTGGSHFSVSLIADLFLSGSKILFLTAYPMATDNFLKQVDGPNSRIARIESKADLVGREASQAIMIKSGDERLFMDVANSLRDIEQRVVFVKNMEVFAEGTIRKCLGFEKVVLSGDIDKCRLKEGILGKAYVTTILFSQPKIEMPFKAPVLQPYTGYLWGKNVEGVISVKMDS